MTNSSKDPREFIDSWMVCDICRAKWGHGKIWPFYEPHPPTTMTELFSLAKIPCPNVGATAWDDQYFSRGIHQEYKYDD